jgi:pseudaminic acid synthase
MEIGKKPFIVAEISGNHGGSLARAVTMITAAAQIGCDAVKIQLYEPDDLCDPENNEIYEKCKTPREWLPRMFEAAERWDCKLFSSVFAPWAVEELKKYDCPAYKLASPESTRLPAYGDLVSAIKQTGKTFIASTGRADWQFVKSFEPDYLLYCLAGYPAKAERTDLFMMDFCDGFSDHTVGVIDPTAMMFFGARIIEKHFKLDDNCIDAAFSLNPKQMRLLCEIAHR